MKSYSLETIEKCLIRMRSMYPYLSKKHKQIVEKMMSDPHEIINLSISELSDMLQVSEGSIVLLCKKLGYKGYHDLKLKLAQEIASQSDIHEEINQKDSIEEVLKKVFNSSIQTLSDTLNVLNVSALTKAAQAIIDKKRIMVIGTGISGIVAKDLWMRFFRIGIDVALYDTQSTIKMAVSIADPGTVVFAITHSGSTSTIVESLKLAHENGCTTIVLTNYLNSPASKVAGIVLLTSSRETGVREEEMTSRIAQLAVIDSLFVYVTNSDYEEAVKKLDKTRLAVADERI
ncbi:MAG: MurR/RpiR family transcriptional regulator [Rectinemataceae bacterium]